MKKLTRRQLVCSLLFPVGIFVWAVGWYFRWAYYIGSVKPVFIFQWGMPIIALVCGVLPAILTLVTGADTGQYILPRVLFSVSTIGVIGIASEFVDVSGQMRIFLMITSAVISALYFYKFRPTKFFEWIVIFFSNPVLAAIIYYLMFTVPDKKLQSLL